MYALFTQNRMFSLNGQCNNVSIKCGGIIFSLCVRTHVGKFEELHKVYNDNAKYDWYNSFSKVWKEEKYCSISNRYRIPEMNVTISIEFLCLLACGVHRLHKFWSSFSFFDFVDGQQTTQAFINTKRRNRKSSFTLLSVTAFETDKVWEFEKKRNKSFKKLRTFKCVGIGKLGWKCLSFDDANFVTYLIDCWQK